MKELKNIHKEYKKIQPFTSKYNWEGIKYKSEKDKSKKFEKNNPTIGFNVFYAKKEKKHPAYVSKHNSKGEKQVILLMILNREVWHCIAVKNFQHY